MQVVPDRGTVNGKGWQRVAMGMMSFVFLLLGAFLGDFAASVRYASLTGKLDAHEASEGHPVMIERVDSIEVTLERIEKAIFDQGVQNSTKLLRQSVILREIEQRMKAENDK